MAEISRRIAEVDFAELTYQHHLAKLMGAPVNMIEDLYGHIVEEFQRETAARLTSFGLADSKVARIA